MSEVSSNRFSTISLVAGIAVLLTLIIWYYFQNSSQTHSEMSIPSIVPNTVNVESNSAATTIEIPLLNQAADSMSDKDELKIELDNVFAEMVGTLRTEFGDQADSIAFHVSLKDLRNDLILEYPEHGLALFERIIREAFPEQARAIFGALEKIDLYDQWLLENMPDLNQMELTKQEEMLWAKRVELFGEAAAEIWTEQLTPEQEREVSVQKTLRLLGTAYEVPLDERLNLLKTSFEENYNGTVAGLVYDSNSVMAQTFFGFDSVQKDLQAMSQEQRQAQINDVRRQLGYSEDRIASLAERDQEREADWKKGYAYMEEKALLEQNLSGKALEAELDTLREKYFTYRAPTIKNEEAGGFFRFTRPRVYGQN